MQRLTIGPISNLRTYNTGLWTTSDGPAPPYLGRGFAYGARFYRYCGPKPREEQERLHSYIGHSPVTEIGERLENGDYHWQSAIEILIFAPSHDRAQRAANLFFAAMLLREAQSLVHDSVIALPEDSEELEGLSRVDRFGEVNWSHQRGLCEGAALAAKLSHRRQWRYAVSKYWISLRICSVPWMETHPTYGKRFGVDLDPVNHVLFAQAIIAAYSVIEELGFEVRASQKTPSRIKGKWNPVVREELETRLRNGGIDLDDDEVLMRRGSRTIVEREGPTLSGAKASWAARDVRDRHVSVVDAIGHASWLRSRVSSHRLSRRAASLTIYDVQNVQMLARRLLLETAGFLPTKVKRRMGPRRAKSALGSSLSNIEISELW
jgi:hypothetical protein